MKWVVGTLAVTACALVVGCSGAGEGSSEGLVRQFVKVWPRENATPEETQKTVEALRALPAKFPSIERFEWGSVERLEGGRAESRSARMGVGQEQAVLASVSWEGGRYVRRGWSFSDPTASTVMEYGLGYNERGGRDAEEEED